MEVPSTAVDGTPSSVYVVVFEVFIDDGRSAQNGTLYMLFCAGISPGPCTSSSFFAFFLCDSLCVGAQFGAFCVRLILPFACPHVIDVLFYEEADARSAVDFLHNICVAMVVYLSHEFVLV